MNRTDAQLIHDLHWSLTSERLCQQLPALPELPRGITAGIASEVASWEQEEDLLPQLRAHLAQRKSTRLGLYFESLWSFYLQRSRHYPLLAHNLRVRAGQKTLGEFDFVYRDSPAGEVVHMEAAVKFYLGVPEPGGCSTVASDWRRWVGPGLKDRLDIKLNQLQTRQLQLAQQPAAQDALAARGIPTPLHRRLEMAGRLFYPATSMAPPAEMNKAHQRGEWLSLAALGAQVLGGDLQARQLALPVSRAQWFAPLRLRAGSAADAPFLATLGPFDQLVRRLQSQYGGLAHFQPFQVAAVVEQGDYLLETRRLFIVPDTWPAAAEASLAAR